MKHGLIILGVFLTIATAAHGNSMCIPSIAGAGGLGNGTMPQTNANRGRWAVGTNCRVNVDTTVNSRPMLCDNVVAYGEAHCSVSGTYPDANWENVGKWCWCRVTDVRTGEKDADGKFVVAPKVGAWVLLASSNCAGNCAGSCASYVRSWGGFRRALFASQGS